MLKGNSDIVFSMPVDGVIKSYPIVIELYFDKEVEIITAFTEIDDAVILKDAISVVVKDEDKYWKGNVDKDALQELTLDIGASVKRFWVCKIQHRVKSRTMFILNVRYKIVSSGEVKLFRTDYFIEARKIK